MRITIVNWKKYQNPRKDIQHSSWFRMEHKPFFDPAWAHFSPEEMYVLMMLLATASMKSEDTFTVKAQAISLAFRVSEETFKSAIQKLEELDVISVTSEDTVLTRNVDVTQTARQSIATRRDETRRDFGDPPSGGPAPVASQTQKDPEWNALSPHAALPTIAQIWNEHAATCFPRVREMSSSSKRRRSCMARWREKPDKDFWTKVIRMMNSSKFLSGKDPKRGDWKADIEFLCRPDKAQEILEGKYHDKVRTPQQEADMARARAARDAMNRTNGGQHPPVVQATKAPNRTPCPPDLVEKFRKMGVRMASTTEVDSGTENSQRGARQNSP